MTGPSPGSPAAGPGVLRIGITSLPTIDPRTLDSPEALLVASQVFDGLVGYEAETHDVVGAVAQSWQGLEGGRRFVFRLREDVRFHDGSLVRAADFIRAWTRLADPFRPSPYAFLLERVQGFREYNRTLESDRITGLSAPDERTLEVRLGVPWPDFPAVLGHPALSPVPEGADFPGYAARPVGNGPYALASDLLPGEPISLTAFADYYGTPPSEPSLQFAVYSDPEAAWPDFLAGELHVSPVPAALVSEAEAQFGGSGFVTLARLVHCGFNLDQPRFRDIRLRRAVALAVDRAAVTGRVYGAVAAPADGILPPTVPGAQVAACGDPCRTDPDEATALVERVEPRQRRFSLDYASSPVGDELAAELVSQLQAVGLRVEARPHEEQDYQQLLEAGNQEFFCLVSVADYPRPQALLEPLFHSGSPDNHTGLDDSRLDRLLDAARSSASDARRQELYADAERRALSLVPLVPLSWFRSRMAARPEVRGLAVDPLGGFDASALDIQP